MVYDYIYNQSKEYRIEEPKKEKEKTKSLTSSFSELDWADEGINFNRSLKNLRMRIGIVKDQLFKDAQNSKALFKESLSLHGEPEKRQQKLLQVFKAKDLLTKHIHNEHELTDLVGEFGEFKDWSSARKDILETIHPAHQKPDDNVSEKKAKKRAAWKLEHDKLTPEEKNKLDATNFLDKIITDLDETYKLSGQFRAELKEVQALGSADFVLKVRKYFAIKKELTKITAELARQVETIVEAKYKNLNMEKEKKIDKAINDVVEKLDKQSKEVAQWRSKYKEQLEIESEIGLIGMTMQLEETSKLSHGTDTLDAVSKRDVETKIKELKETPPIGGGMGFFIIRKQEQIDHFVEASLREMIQGEMKKVINASFG